MSLRTFSSFFYGHEITRENNFINFSEGGPELTAELSVGAYTLTDFVTELQSALNQEGALTYTVTVSRTTRKITIAATGTFSLLTNSGSQAALAPWELMGFSEVSDKTGSSSYLGDTGSGYAYNNQFILQDHVDPDHWSQAVDSSVNKSAAGNVETVSFGTENFLQFNIKYITNYTQSGNIIKDNGSGVADILQFLNYITKKAPIEFMEDIDSPNSFINILLESTEENQKGTGFKLREMYDKGLPGYFETGRLKFRVYNL